MKSFASDKGAYIVEDENYDVILLASGSEFLLVEGAIT